MWVLCSNVALHLERRAPHMNTTAEYVFVTYTDRYLNWQLQNGATDPRRAGIAVEMLVAEMGERALDHTARIGTNVARAVGRER